MSKDGVVTANFRSMLSILFACLVTPEYIIRAKDTSSEPDSVSLHHILCANGLHTILSSSHRIEFGHSFVQNVLHLCLKPYVESFEECATSRQYNILIKFDSVLNWATLDSIVNNLTKRLNPILMNEFRMEEHLRSKEALISDINIDHVVVEGLKGELLELR